MPCEICGGENAAAYPFYYGLRLESTAQNFGTTTQVTATHRMLGAEGVALCKNCLRRATGAHHKVIALSWLAALLTLAALLAVLFPALGLGARFTVQGIWVYLIVGAIFGAAAGAYYLVRNALFKK